MKKGRKGKGDEDLTGIETNDQIVRDLINKMSTALEDDMNSNELKKTAFKRLLMINQIEKTLIKQDMHEPFINLKGCQILSTWLMPMPDKTYPNAKIVMMILQSLDRLPITTDNLEECKDLEYYVDIYRKGNAGQSHKECQALAKSILNKWYREKDGI